MAYIEPEAMRKLTASLREKGRADFAQAQRRQMIARQKRWPALQFDIQQALRAGDLEAAQKLQQASYRADALDRGELAGVRAAQDFDVREAEGAERRRVEKNDAFRPLGGVTERAGPITAENTIVLPGGIASKMLRGPSATMVNQEAQQKIAFARQDEAMRKKPVLSPDVLATRKAGAEYAARKEQSDLAKAPAVAIDEYWRPDVTDTLSKGGTIRMGGKVYSAQHGRNKLLFDEPRAPDRLEGWWQDPPRRRRQPTAAPAY